jgi:hypothetical protein
MAFWIGVGIGILFGASAAMISVVLLKFLLFLKSSARADYKGRSKILKLTGAVIKGERSN